MKRTYADRHYEIATLATDLAMALGGAFGGTTASHSISITFGDALQRMKYKDGSPVGGNGNTQRQTEYNIKQIRQPVPPDERLDAFFALWG